MKSAKTIVILAFLTLFLLTSGLCPAEADVYEASNDYKLYGHLYRGDLPITWTFFSVNLCST
jgi:hypothetical protein